MAVGIVAVRLAVWEEVGPVYARDGGRREEGHVP